ncbi:MAG: hypothetical protein KGI53_14020 [Nitrospirota bacterium]|nr:hypothetical protein [Nitrospirota bacterium]
MHYLLFYEKAPGYQTRQGPLQAPHLAYVQAAVRRGELVLAGSLLDPNDGAAVLLFKADSPAVAEAFAKGDPYVTQGIVNKWWVRKWDTVVGKEAANPLSE